MNSTFGTTANATATTNTNFDLGILESKEFWLGLQRPLSAETLDFLVREGLPRELLFYLFIQKAVLRSQGLTQIAGERSRQSQLPCVHPGSSGLRWRSASPPRPSRALSNTGLRSRRSAPRPERAWSRWRRRALLLRPEQTANGMRYQMLSVQPAAVMCFDPSLDIGGGRASAASGRAATRSGQGHRAHRRRRSRSASPRQGGASVDLARHHGGQDLCPLDPRHHPFPRLADEERNRGRTRHPGRQPPGSSALADRLFVVNMDSPSADDFVSVVYRGTRYSIPMQATSTIRVFTLLRRLVALSTSLNALPVSNTVTTVVR